MKMSTQTTLFTLFLILKCLSLITPLNTSKSNKNHCSVNDFKYFSNSIYLKVKIKNKSKQVSTQLIQTKSKFNIGFLENSSIKSKQLVQLYTNVIINSKAKNKNFLKNQLKEKDLSQKNEEEYIENIKLKRNKDSTYVAEVYIGSPPIKYDLLMDTGSSNLIVSSIRCDSTACNYKSLYNPDKSTSYVKVDSLNSYYSNYFSSESIFLKKDSNLPNKITDDDNNIFMIKGDKVTNSDTVTIEYGAGTLTGIAFKDKVCLNKLCCDSSLILETIEEKIGFDKGQFDGIIGLDIVYDGFDADNNIINNLFKEGKIKNKSFSMYLNKYDHLPSELTIGSINNQRVDMNSLNYYKLQTDDYWEIQIKNIYYGETLLPICDEKRLCTGILDSGTDGIAMEEKDYARIFNIIKVNEDCSNVKELKNIIFELVDLNGDTIKLELDPEYFVKKYLIEYNENTTSASQNSKFECKNMIFDINIIDFEDRDAIVLGSSFMKKFYTVFDKEKEKVGIGLAKHLQ